jgi:hypothetical protein
MNERILPHVMSRQKFPIWGKVNASQTVGKNTVMYNTALRDRWPNHFTEKTLVRRPALQFICAVGLPQRRDFWKYVPYSSPQSSKNKVSMRISISHYMKVLL